MGSPDHVDEESGQLPNLTTFWGQPSGSSCRSRVLVGIKFPKKSCYGSMSRINTLFRKRLNRGFLQPWVISSGAPKVKNEIIILKYATDEKRLRHRPRDVSLKNWKILLTYWGDENGQEIAKRNVEARKK
ncbi:uncharacterized protein LOC141672795 isoform X2 [Apium graveolens]|uniref:uncharacterized protein LOC141672795 isoform X2 n=1 Tax=Apium graveolens TaxID=4045 RepID=UPI003D7A8419